METKICSSCKYSLEINQFSKNRQKLDGLHNQCKKCASISSEKWRILNREKDLRGKREYYKQNTKRYLELARLRTHRISQKEFDALFKTQNNCCGICAIKTSGKRDWHLDHDHKTGKIRGILCRACNIMLGMAKDNPDILEAAATFVRVNRTHNNVYGN